MPPCTDDEAISVACLDLFYHVSVHGNAQHIKPEREETHFQVSSLGDVPEERDVTDQADMEGKFDQWQQTWAWESMHFLLLQVIITLKETKLER